MSFMDVVASLAGLLLLLFGFVALTCVNDGIMGETANDSRAYVLAGACLMIGGVLLVLL